MNIFIAKTKKNKGFSLIEVLLVIVILVIAFFPLIQILSRVMIASGEAKETNTALKIAQDKLEQIKNTAYDSISSETKAPVASFPVFSREVIVSEPSNNLKNVRVIVYWFAGEGSEISIEVESIKTGF